MCIRDSYWGEPIPIVHCPKCGPVAVPEDQLPLLLPEVESYEPTDNGESPLAKIDSFVETTCPQCGAPARRETDTMPQWAGSSWYFLRYMDPHNADALASPEALSYWGPVDWYKDVYKRQIPRCSATLRWKKACLPFWWEPARAG